VIDIGAGFDATNVRPPRSPLEVIAISSFHRCRVRHVAALLMMLMLGLPAIALAGLKEIYELYKAHLDTQGWSILALGLVVGSISAFVAIFVLMRVLERFSAWPFVVYRALIGILLLVGASGGWLS